MARLSGKDLYVSFAGTDISGDFRTLEINQEGIQEDITAGDDAANQYVAIRKDGNASFEALYDATNGTAHWAIMDVNTAGTLEWGEQGTASGKPKGTVIALVSSRSKSIPYDGAMELSFEFQFNGAVTDASY